MFPKKFLCCTHRYSSSKSLCSLLVQCPTPRMWRVKWSRTSGAELMVKGCHSEELSLGRIASFYWWTEEDTEAL